MIDKITNWIREKVDEAGASGIVVGMSGGLDSSVTAALCKKAVKTLGLIMPCHSNPEDLKHAELVAKTLGIETKTLDLTETYDRLVKALPPGDKIPKANLKPRLRMLTLYYFANLNKCLVVGTGNKTEVLTGYFTKHGDDSADILPLGGLYKTQVIALAKELGIPQEIIDKPPSAGLWPGQEDEKELGIKYNELDRILEALERGETKGISGDKLGKVRKMIKSTKHKREAPPVCRV